MQESDSFWTDIKNLGEQLASRPDSLCFARLSDVYLKVGLLDDALHVARQGVIRHPRYLSGQRALALASHAKGLNGEALAALNLVTEALPEDLAAQKLFGRLLVEAGNHEAACQAFRTALEFVPDDVECRIELESLERSGEDGESTFESDADDEIIEDLEILEELDILEEDQTEADFEVQDISLESDVVEAPQHDPLSTGTLAELYVSQGFIYKALEIYRAILADNPTDRATAERVTELETLDTANGEESGLEDASGVEDASGIENRNTDADFSWQQSIATMVPQQGRADNSLATLDGWLENIRRIKSCR
jgi:tetratricopeptide (TPR) repeat protein